MKLAGFIFSLFLAASAFATSLPSEDQLQDLMLNQNEPAFVTKGLAKNHDGSSLCGPASAINWLQLEGANLSKSEQIELLSSSAQLAKNAGLDITQGLIEPQLLEFLEILNQSRQQKVSYQGLGRYFKDTELSLEALLQDKPQLLLLKYESRPQEATRTDGGRSPRGRSDFPARDGTETIRGFHFVLKVSANSHTGEIIFLDPENPARYSYARLELRQSPITTKADLRLLPSSDEDLRHFKTGPRLLWSVLSLIEKN